MEPHAYLQRYERFMLASKSSRTIRQRLRMASRILERWPDPGQADTLSVVEWLGSLGSEAGHPPTRWTKATYHSDARAFFRWLAGGDFIHTDPMVSDLAERPKAQRGVPKPLSAAEEARALTHARGHMQAWLLLALRAGLRASEIGAFSGESIAEDFIILTGKNDKESAIPTHTDLWDLAQEYPRRGWWFPSQAHGGHVSGHSVTILVGRHFRRPEVDIPKGSVHRCRHSYATDMLRRGVNIRVVQELMRHGSPATTAIYTAVNEDERRAAINLLGPVA